MKKITTHPKGSILIMTFVLGLSLTAVFFAFSQSLTINARAQKKSMDKQASELLLDSYVDYIQGLVLADLKTIRGDINFEGITGTLTNETEQIAGVLDAGDSVSYSASLSNGDRIKIEWDLCDPGADDTEKLEINDAMVIPSDGGCLEGYKKFTEISSTSFTLSAPAGPVHYKLSVIGEATLYDNKWQLDLELPLGFRKKLTINTSFIPSS